MLEAPARRVVITGLGAVSSIGIGTGEFLGGLRKGRSAAKEITAFSTEGYEYSIACEIDDFEPSRWIRRVNPEHIGRASQCSVAAARMAANDAGLDEEELREHRCLISIGPTDGESRDLDHLVETVVRHGPEAMDPYIARRVPAGRLSASIAQELALSRVEAVTLPTVCAAGNYAIGYGYDAIRAGDVDYVLCGGADALCRKTFTGFHRLGTIAPERCQP